MNNKIVSIILVIIFVPLLFFMGCTSSKNIAPLQAGEAFQLVDHQQFIFVADKVLPFRGGVRNLTSEYNISVKKDSLVSYLPFFGRATQAPMNPSEGGIQFTSTDFSYKVVSGKKNRKDVTIIPNDQRDIQQLHFIIFDNGTGTLNVTSTYRDPITFNGHLRRVIPNVNGK